MPPARHARFWPLREEAADHSGNRFEFFDKFLLPESVAAVTDRFEKRVADGFFLESFTVRDLEKCKLK